MNQRKLIVISVVIAVFIFFEAIVARQFMGDLWLRKGKAVLAETEGSADSPGDGQLAGYLLAGEHFKKAIFWDGRNADSHYWLSRLYQILTHRYARREGKWDEKAGLFVEGEKSKSYGRLAIEEFYRAIDINPACQYFHLELAWLLRSKLATVPMTAKEMLDQEGTYSRELLSVYNTCMEFERATDLAPKRTMHHMSFGDFLTDMLVDAEKKGGIEVREKDLYESMLKKAVREYGMVLAFTPARIGDALKSLTRVTTDYEVLRPIIPADNMGLKIFIFYLNKVKGGDDVLTAFQRDMEAFVASHDGKRDSAETLFPYYDTLAELYLKENKYGQAAAALEEYLRHDPDDAKVHARVADMYIKGQNFEKAQVHLSRATRLDPEEISYRGNLVSVIISGYNPVAAEPLLSDLAGSFPEDPNVYEGLGKNYIKMGKVEEAEAAYRKIIEKTKDNARGYYLLGKLYEVKGSKEKADTYLKKAALLNGRYRQDFNKMYPLDVLLREYFQTTHEYDTLKKLIPFTPESLNGLVLFLYKEGAWNINNKAFITDMKRTEERFARLEAEEKPLKDIRSWLIAYYGTLSEIYKREGKHCQSITILERLTGLDPENHEAWFMLALESEKHLKKCGYDSQFVEHSYENALSGEPENATYLKGYARFLAEEGDLTKAERTARKIIELVPKDPEAHEILAYIYEKSGKTDGAIAELSEAVSLSRGEKQYREKLSDLLRK